jgi:hypothetical protein
MAAALRNVGASVARARWHADGTAPVLMRLRYLGALVIVTACAPRYKREVIGGGTATVQARAALDVTTSDVAGAVGAVGVAHAAAGRTMELARGDYELVLRFDVPRAQIVEYTVACPGIEERGSLGETFAAYRERRLAQLRADRDRERRRTAAVTGAVIGAVAPDVHARGEAAGPGGHATVDAQVSGQAVGAAAGTAIADATVSDIVELPAWDVGATQLHAKLRVAIAEQGACTISALADDTNVRAMFDLVHVRDLKAEDRARKAASTAGAREVRVELNAQLVALGADPLARQRRLEAEARARAEAEARVAAQREAEARARAERQAKIDAELRLRAEAEARARAEHQAKIDGELRLRAEVDARARAERQAKLDIELRAKADLELRLRSQALHTRGALVAYLTGECNADPHHRQRIRQEREARVRVELDARAERERTAREQRELRLRIELQAKAERERVAREQREARIRVERERALAIEAEWSRRLGVALATRASLRAYLVALGARERPPMPAPLLENPGTPPFSDAEWIAGTWRWTGGQWIWQAGGWQDTTVFGATGQSGGVIGGGSVGGSVEVGASWELPVSIGGSSSSAGVRDHRTGTPSSSPGGPTVRDHRTGSSSSTPNGPTVRDHRTDSSGSPSSEPAVRDHRDGSSSGSSSSSPTVRDHRSSSSSSGTTTRDHRKSDDDDKKSGSPRVRDHRR